MDAACVQKRYPQGEGAVFVADKRNPYADVRSNSSFDAKPSGNGGKRGKGPLIAFIAVVIVAAVAILAIVPRFSGTPSSATTSTPTSQAVTTSAASSDADASMTVTLVVDATEHGDGVLFSGDVQVPEEGTVKDALEASGLTLSTRQSLGMGTYVAGINGIMEKAKASTSGWVFSVNGERSQYSCDAAKVDAGDAIEWDWKLDGTSA